VQDNNNKSYIITAVYKLPNANTVFKPGYLTLPEAITENRSQWTNFSYIGFFKLKPNTDVVDLQDKLSKQLQKEEKIMSEKMGRTIR
jgi:putative ABC transport system permease protein